MTKDGIIKCLMTLIMVVYLVFAISFTSHLASIDTFKGVEINVRDNMSRKFVSEADIDMELDSISRWITSLPHDSLNTQMIEDRLTENDNIEKANCVVLNDGTLRIDVVPLIPVARVFDSAGTNYYINRSGKRMQASIRYSMDVPVITGNFAGRITPSLAFPLLDYLNTDPDMAALTSSINIAPNSDVILVPSIKGHVVNLGDSADLPNKMARLKVFYKKVMPVKGWEYYDTISVKWRGQVVARRRDRKPDYKVLLAEEHIDLDDEGTMLTTASADQN